MYYCSSSLTSGRNVLLPCSRWRVSQGNRTMSWLLLPGCLLGWLLSCENRDSILLQRICKLPHRVSHPRWQYSYSPLWEPEIPLIQYFSINSVICGICNSLINSWFVVQSCSCNTLNAVRGYRMKIVGSAYNI